MRGDRRRCRSTRPEGLAERKLRSQLVNNMAKVSFFRFGLRYNEKATDPGAQTERRGEAGPVSVLLRGWDSPAAFVNQSTPSNHRGGDRKRIAKDAEAILGLGEQRVRARCQVDREGKRPDARAGLGGVA